MARNECRRFLGWDHSNPYGNLLHIVFKELKGTSIRTPEGMVGYCVKDMNEYEGWEVFQHHMVTPDDIQIGLDLYTMFGAPEKKNVVCLTRNNIMECAFAFWKTRRRSNIFSVEQAPLLEVLCGMLQTGFFRPTAEWIIPRFGEGMDMRRARAMFRVHQDPNSATEQDVADLILLLATVAWAGALWRISWGCWPGWWGA